MYAGYELFFNLQNKEKHKQTYKDDIELTMNMKCTKAFLNARHEILAINQD